MKLDDFNRLKKFMALAESENDYESFSALKMANQLLKKEGLNWDRVLSRSITIVNEVEDADTVAVEGTLQDTRLAAAFEKLENMDTSSFADVVTDIRGRWENGRQLSPKQRTLIMDAAARQDSQNNRARR